MLAHECTGAFAIGTLLCHVLAHKRMSTFTHGLLGNMLAHERASTLTQTLLSDMLTHHSVSCFSTLDLSTCEKHGAYFSTKE